MAVSDDTILTLAKELGNLNGTLTQVVDTMKTHISDPQAHSSVIPRTESLEGSRSRFRRALMAAGATSVGTATAGTKLGWFAKVAGILTAGNTP